MSYDYVKRTYAVEPRVGERVRHKETEQVGTISRENPGQGHYVMVRFDGTTHPLPCHPMALDYLRTRA